MQLSQRGELHGRKSMKALAIVMVLAAPAFADDKAAAERDFRAGSKAYSAQDRKSVV